MQRHPRPQNPATFRDLYPDPGLLQHEWQTHGTCSGLAPDAFFSLARRAVHAVAIPTQLTSLNQQTSMAPEAILDLFSRDNPSIPRESLALSCGNNYLTAVELCLSKDLHPSPASRSAPVAPTPFASRHPEQPAPSSA